MSQALSCCILQRRRGGPLYLFDMSQFHQALKLLIGEGKHSPNFWAKHHSSILNLGFPESPIEDQGRGKQASALYWFVRLFCCLNVLHTQIQQHLIPVNEGSRREGGKNSL